MAPKQKSYADEVRARIRKTGGRNSKRTPERAVAIATALKAGASREAAAGNAGVTYNTLWRWMTDDAEMDALVIEAESAAEVTFVSRIYTAAQGGTWQAAAWMLERRWPKRYGRRDRTDVTIETQRLAETIAEAEGLDAGELIAEAQSIVVEARERNKRADDS